MKFEKRHIDNCIEIWNSYVDSGDVPFKPLSKEDFCQLFLCEKYISKGVVKEENGEAVGFAFGTINGDTGYVSYVGVKKDKRKSGMGKELYFELEKTFFEVNPHLEKVDCMFYNPCSIPWFIPNHFPHDHSGVPGVYMECDGYPFLKKMGFCDYAVQNAYYMPLDEYQAQDSVSLRLEKLEKEGIEVCFFDKEKHFGFSELFDNIKNEGWRKSVMSRLDEKIVVAVKDNAVIGYTGPLSVSKEKRGLFCGIGVHTDYRSHGIGKVLFSRLCIGLKDMGAEFMSLFTGDNNPARFVYESTGFQLVGKFSCMRKNMKY